MLAIHWSPVSNTKAILKNGIRRSKNGLYCFPLTGIKQVDKLWVNFFNRYAGCRHRHQYNGFVFRITAQDFPAFFGHCSGATTEDVYPKEIPDLKTLEKIYRENIVFRAGEKLVWERKQWDLINSYEICRQLGNEIAANNPEKLAAFQKSYDSMAFMLEDYQIVLSRSISADRIMKVIPQGDESGRTIKRKKKWGVPRHRKQVQDF